MNYKPYYTLDKVGNYAIGIVGYVVNAMKVEGMSNEEVYKYVIECSKGEYDHLVEVSQETLNKVNTLWYQRIKKLTQYGTD